LEPYDVTVAKMASRQLLGVAGIATALIFDSMAALPANRSQHELRMVA
jgi:hypothetical protein